VKYIERFHSHTVDCGVKSVTVIILSAVSRPQAVIGVNVNLNNDETTRLIIASRINYKAK